MKYEELGKGIVKRSEKRVLGLFIDGTGLDRATRRLNRKVDLSALVRGVTAGTTPVVARYYTLIPYEDDSRQRAFLDAVHKAGLTVIVKRLPPKGVNRQVSVEVEMASDIAAFALGHQTFSELSEYKAVEPLPQGGALPTALPFLQQMHRGPRSENKSLQAEQKTTSPQPVAILQTNGQKIQRIVTVVCPGRDLAYTISLARELGADTVNADFGQFSGGDILKSAAKWIDLSDSETIWR